MSSIPMAPIGWPWSVRSTVIVHALPREMSPRHMGSSLRKARELAKQLPHSCWARFEESEEAKILLRHSQTYELLIQRNLIRLSSRTPKPS